MSEQKKMANLVKLIKQVAADYNMDVKVEGPNTMREYHLDVGDGSMQIWVSFDEDEPGSDEIMRCISLAMYDFGASEIDDLLEYPWDDFLADTEDLGIKPPEKNYGIDFLNIIAWHLGAYGQKTKNDIENRFDAGWYKVRGTIMAPDGFEARIGYWIEATSSDDAKRQFLERSNNTGKDLKIDQFVKEKPEFGPGDFADEMP
jgi:hypothetical protein